MTNLYTQTQVESLCRKVGFTKKKAKVAAAIAMCESAYPYDGKQYADADAVGDIELANEVWGYSYGLFQIRSLRDQKGTGDVRDEDKLPRPAFNAKSALQIANTTGFKAWSTFTSGMYKAYLQDIFPPAEGTYIVVGGDTLSGIAYKLGLDWTDLARWNNIHAPYTIFIGQVILLADPLGA